MEQRQLVCPEHSEGTGRGREIPQGLGLPAVIPTARDTNQDFKQDIPWLPSRVDGRGPRGCCSNFNSGTGPHGHRRSWGTWLCSCKGTMRLLQESQADLRAS